MYVNHLERKNRKNLNNTSCEPTLSSCIYIIMNHLLNAFGKKRLHKNEFLINVQRHKYICMPKNNLLILFVLLCNSVKLYPSDLKEILFILSYPTIRKKKNVCVREYMYI